MKKFIKICFYLLIILFAVTILSKSSIKHNVNVKPSRALHVPAVGAIRWDAWYSGSNLSKTEEIALSPEKWHYRLPFYAVIPKKGTVQIRLDTQAQMDFEIRAAKAGGLDYWAFGYYGDNDKNANALKKYLNSAHKADMRYALLLFPQAIGKSGWLGQVVAHFSDPLYMKVLNGRPLLYVFDAGGSISKNDLESVRSAAKSAGLPNPYIAWMTWDVQDGKCESHDCDAIANYGLSPTGNPLEVVPYQNLANVDLKFSQDAENRGLKVIPPVGTGWDPRPGYDYPPPWGAGYKTAVTNGTPQEIAENLNTAIHWANSNGSAESKVILIYAWNEFEEGGWLTPMLQGGAERLTAISSVMSTLPKK